MNSRYAHRERLVALFLFAALLFHPPLLLIFDTRSTVLGIPALYLYLFVAWAISIVLLALIIEFSTVPPDPSEHNDAVDADGNGELRTEGREP